MEEEPSRRRITAVFQLGGDKRRYDAATHDGFRFERQPRFLQFSIEQRGLKLVMCGAKSADRVDTHSGPSRMRDARDPNWPQHHQKRQFAFG